MDPDIHRQRQSSRFLLETTHKHGLGGRDTEGEGLGGGGGDVVGCLGEEESFRASGGGFAEESLAGDEVGGEGVGGAELAAGGEGHCGWAGRGGGWSGGESRGDSGVTAGAGATAAATGGFGYLLSSSSRTAE